MAPAFAYDHIHLRSPDAEATAQAADVRRRGNPLDPIRLLAHRPQSRRVAVFIAQVPEENVLSLPLSRPISASSISGCGSRALTRSSPS